MRLEKLELSGFKSFPDRTILKFEPGITAIVGPNGSGKSNIFDAIRWVLGEQSVKEMRGSKMEDVIFNGTDTREPLGMAEVSLTLSNEDKKLSIEDKEVVITRRIFRSGENEYFINHNPVRLKDIIDLLLGSGIGIDSYSLVGQGKIELILSSKPEDRRIIFDEASGILKYKLQKKEATRKLEETENNLSRINDIIAEVKRQINSLERQAEKARRYKEIFQQLKEKEKILGILKINKLNGEKESLLNQLKKYSDQEISLKENYQEKLLQRQNCEDEIKRIEEGIFKLREEIIHIEHLMERNREAKETNRERIEDLKHQKEKLKEDIQQAQEKLKRIRSEIDNFHQDYQNLEDLLNKKISLFQEKQDYLKQIDGMRQEAKENIERSKRKIIELNDIITKIKNELIDLDTQLKVKEAREKRLKIEEIKCQQEKDTIQKDLDQVKQELDNLENNFSTKKQAMDELKGKLERESKDIEELKSNIYNLEKEKAKLISQKEFLENLNINYQSMGQSLNTVILTDHLPQDDFNGLVVRIKEKLNSSISDKAVFAEANFKLYGEAKPIDFNPQRIISKIGQIEEEINQNNRLIQDKKDNIVNFKKEFENIDAEIHQLELEISKQKNQFNHIEAQLKKIDEELQIITLELSEVRTEIDNLREKQSSLTKEYNDLEDKIKIEEENLHKANERITHLDSERETCLLEITQIKTEKSSLEESLEKENQTLKVLEENLEETFKQIKGYQDRILECEEKIKKLNSELINLDASDEELAKKKLDKIEDTKTEQIKLQDLIRNLEGFKGNIEELRNRIEEINSLINDLKMRIQDLDFKISNIKDRLKQVYEIELQESEETLTQEYNEENLSLEIETFKQKLDSLGTVNLVAIEEYDEFKKRYDFLIQQQQDLIKAKDSLYEAIQKINRTAKNMFMETFKLIGEQFKNYFRLLFGGGEANLFLIEEKDPLESGIEIIARPPGKKLQSITLLSGGEKALCAIALIFAIFKVKPSPFCILDEVDAALDEANVSRYTNLLDEFSKSSQFIVITHNKRTLLNADVMYGITMEESGISRVVSVKFGKSKEEKTKTKPEEVSVFT